MKKALKIMSLIIFVPVLLFGIFLIYISKNDYKPKGVEEISEGKGGVINVYDTLKIFNWNIGYCGLGDDMSFFYDGGENVRTSKNRTLENLAAVIETLKKYSDVDFYLLQEIDRNSKRSYKLNQFDSICEALPKYFSNFALNYKVPFVPIPITSPLGKVDGGLATFSKSEPFSSVRHSFPGNYGWPKGLFLLDRCFLVNRYYTSDGKELLIINTHNSAYDDGTLRKEQMEVLKLFLLEEYSKGNYILVGGDWNQNPPVVGKDASVDKERHLTRIRIASDFMPEGWKWSFCEKIPTNRLINEAYNPETTITTTIDFYLLSPNLMAVSQQNIDLAFKNSDHNPLVLSFVFLH